MCKRTLYLILCICFLFTACSKNKEVSNDNENSQHVQENTVYDDDEFELIAIKSDNQGIDNSTGFQLTSKESIDINYIKNNLKIIPDKEFKVEELSSKSYNIIPLSLLENDKIYQVKINDKDYVYSWAFQTKKNLQVEGTLPANNSEDVPWNSGIEMYFTLENLGKIDDFFEINPHVEGKFITNNNTIVFVPEQLERNTVYTVTIKKGFGLIDGSDILEEDYVFSFSTQKDMNSQIYFARPIINIHENNPKIVDAYIQTEKEFNINIYQYKDSDKFAQDVFNFADTGKFPKEIDNNKLTLINSFKQKPFMQEISYYQNALFELPYELTKGYYLVEFNAVESENKQYLFLQINDILIYNALFDNQVLVFACDSNTSDEIQNAEIILNDKSMGYTDENGVLVLNEKPSKFKSINLRVKKEGFNDFIYAENLFNNHYYFMFINSLYNYSAYMDTDRPVYLPNDTVNVWGFARYRDNKSLNKVKIELVELNTELILDTKYADLTDIGTYETQFELKNITSEVLKINVYDNDNFVSTEYISVREYTKPLFTLDGTLDKEFAFTGENINYKINANFFDGNPVPNVKLNFYTHNYSYRGNVIYNGMNQVITLNENGEYTVSLNTNVKSNNWRPVTINLDCFTNEAEDKPVSVNDNFKIFPKNKMLEIEQNTDIPQSLNILFHELKMENYKPDNDEDYYYYYYDGFKNLRGNPLDDVIQVKIIERYYEKIKIGEQYDFISKVNEILYDYKLVENTVYNDSVNTVLGIANVQIPNYNEERNYDVIAYYEDNDGGIQEESYVYGKRFSYNDKYYKLEKEDNKDNYRLNDSINFRLKYEEKDVENIENDNLFVMFMKNNLIDYKVSDSTSIQTTFKEDYIPNIFLYGVYVKNGYTYPVSQNDALRYDRTERQLYLDVTTNKEEYLPGEEVTIDVKAKDENNKPLVADVNFSVVDEAYFAMFNKNVNTLKAMYEYSWVGGLRRSYLSNLDLSERIVEAEMGGGGGEDGAFRDDFKDTSLFKTITTDKNGNGTLKFKLADNLTSWRITYQGITDKLYAGSGTKNITVSLPFFVDLIMNKEYLKEDKINISLRVFGENAKESEQVEYKVTVKNKDNSKKSDYSATGKAGDYTNIELNKLSEGQYEIYVTAKCNNNEDKIKEEFSVVDSFIYFNNTDYYKISENTVLDEVFSNPVITLFNESTSDFYNSLSNISSSYGKRIDQTICSMLAIKYINDYFSTDLYFNEEEMLNEINKYESREGGFKLFPYSEPSTELTAKLTQVIDNDYLEEKMKVYFKNKLNAEEYNKDIAPAMWGLSKFKEPMLLTIYDLLENKNENLETRDKIYLSLALAEFGDYKNAKKYYKELTSNLKNSGDYLYFADGADEKDNYEITALLSVLGTKVQDYAKSDKLFKYIYNKPSKFTLSNFEQLIYIMNRDIMKLDEIKDLFGEVTVNVSGNTKTYKLKLFDRESFSVKKDQIKDIKFSNINGSIACKVEALGNKNDLDKNKSGDFSISIYYMKKDISTKQTNFNHSDVVKVTITPSYSPKVENGFYEITYIIPSGFRFIDSEINPSWLNVNGQKVTYDCSYSKKYPQIVPMVFYIQAVQKGEYTVDYAVIKEYFEAKLNYVEKAKLIVNWQDGKNANI